MRVLKRTNANLEVGRFVGNSRNKVIGNDGEWMSIESNTHGSINSSVDNPKTVALSRGERDIVVGSTALSILVRAIDQNIVTSRRSTTESAIKRAGSSLERSDIVPAACKW
jgi:hypothetical protein